MQVDPKCDVGAEQINSVLPCFLEVQESAFGLGLFSVKPAEQSLSEVQSIHLFFNLF